MYASRSALFHTHNQFSPNLHHCTFPFNEVSKDVCLSFSAYICELLNYGVIDKIDYNSRDGVCKLQVYVTLVILCKLHSVTRQFCKLPMGNID